MYKNRVIKFFVTIIIIMFTINSPIIFTAQDNNNEVDFNKIDKYIKSEMEKLNIPGCSVGIVNKDEVVFLKSYGKADNNERIIDENTPFILGSVSKTFTAMAIMQLVEEGKIELNSPVQKYIPWFTLSDSELSKKITIRQLLNHTSGLPREAPVELRLSKDDLTIEEFVRKQNNTEIINPVGLKFQYSNLGYIILGQVIQSVTGISYEEYIEQNIFEPLEMEHSFTSLSKAKENGLTRGYQPFFGYMFPTNPPYNQYDIPKGVLISSSKDMSNFLIALMNNGEYKDKSILSSKSILAMKQRSNVAKNYGFGLMIYKGEILHGGDTQNFNSNMKIFGQGEWGLVILINANDITYQYIQREAWYDDISNGIRNIVLDKEVTETEVSLTKKYLPINIILFVIVVFCVLGFIRLPKWYNKMTENYRNFKDFKYSILAQVIFYIVLPVIYYQLISKYLIAWRSFLIFWPGVAHILFAAPMILICTGILKIFLIIKNKRNNINNTIQK